MTLYWYMHWFWITILVRLYAFKCDETLNATTIHSTTVMDTESHRFAKSIGPFSVNPPITSPVRSRQNNITQQSIKQMSVIEPNVNASMTDNFTYVNATDVTVTNPSDASNNSNESISTSERIGIVESEVNTNNLSAAGITGITLGCVSLVGIISAVGFLLYRNRGFNRPQVLSDRCSNLDSSGYIDDTSVRDNSEEMYSLDNDSFLNSLEAMTIQNYWTDTVKHTKL